MLTLKLCVLQCNDEITVNSFVALILNFNNQIWSEMVKLFISNTKLFISVLIFNLSIHYFCKLAIICPEFLENTLLIKQNCVTRGKRVQLQKSVCFCHPPFTQTILYLGTHYNCIISLHFFKIYLSFEWKLSEQISMQYSNCTIIPK